jgi:Response regulators consisting of a CheY-like receiver domain and a winged-helix DNA-binding domain
MNKYKILIIEDDVTLATTLAYNLEQAGYDITIAHTAANAQQRLFSMSHDLVIMDVNLPDGNGFELCKTYRQENNTPLIFLTANDLEKDKLIGYELGGDDYITKPFSVMIFIKKIEAIFKRIKITAPNIYSDGKLKINFDNMEVFFQETPLDITTLEFKILRMFIENPTQILTREIFLEKLWDVDEKFVDDHALTASISRLRKKIEKENCHYIKTIYGMGYIWLGESK